MATTKTMAVAKKGAAAGKTAAKKVASKTTTAKKVPAKKVVVKKVVAKKAAAKKTVIGDLNMYKPATLRKKLLAAGVDLQPVALKNLVAELMRPDRDVGH
jgi:hypothetical protein